jgi:hypothetical protein
MVMPLPAQPIPDEPDTDAMDLVCGALVCSNPSAGLPLPLDVAAPCCLDATQSLCGLQNGDGVCVAVPTDHAVCPPLVTGLGVDAASCCIEETNECGLVDPFGDLESCTSLTEFAEVNDSVAGLLAVPTPVDCDGNPLPDPNQPPPDPNP